MALPLDAYLKAIAALTSLGFAWALHMGGGRDARLLAGFLGFIALNQAAETGAAATMGSANAAFSSLATVAAALDPLLLVAFACTYANKRLGAAWRWSLGAAAVLLVAAAPFHHPGVTLTTFDMVAHVGISAYTAVAYSLALALVLREPHEPRVARPLVIAMTIAALPVWARAGTDLLHAINQMNATPHSPFELVAMHAGMTLAFSVWISRRASGDRKQAVGPALAAGVIVLLLLDAYVINVTLRQAGFAPDLPALALFGRAGASIRWLAFGALVSTAVIRDRLLDLTLVARRRAARVILALAFLAGAFLLAAALQLATGQPTFSLRPLEMAFLLGALLLSQGMRDLLDRAAHGIYGVPPARDEAARREAYRAAALQAATNGTRAARAKLERVRTELGFDDATARAMEAVAEAEAPLPLEPGRLFAGRYEVRAVLGSGGGGRALLARDTLVERDVVLKEVRVDGLTEESDALHEARAMGALRHPHIVTLYDVVPRRRGYILVLEHAAGGTLAERMELGTLTPTDALATLLAILDALSAAHASGIVHRDVKPSNILFGHDGRAMLSDFGLAKLGALDDTRRLDGWGTPRFAAPEQRMGEPVTAAADVYAVGLLGEMLLQDALTPSVADVLRRAHAQAPAQRFADARAMAAALRSAAAKDARQASAGAAGSASNS